MTLKIPLPEAPPRRGRIIADPVLIALADICELFEGLPADRQAWAFAELSRRYNRSPEVPDNGGP